MPKDLTGSVLKLERKRRDGRIERRYYARVCYTDPVGKRRELRRRAESPAHARAILRQLVAELKGERQARLTAPPVTFADYAMRYAETYLIPPEYRHGRRIAGLRSWRQTRALLRPLVEHLGRIRLRDINYHTISYYRYQRLHSHTARGTLRSVASVNRELALLRRILNAAVADQIIPSNPFHMGPPLIRQADEIQRNRILSADEERRLLAACVDKRAHLRPLIIAALDTGMRRGELLKLRWSDIDESNMTITVRALNTKTQTARTVPLTSRLRDELALLRHTQGGRSELVFPFSDIKRGFKSAARAAKIDDLRFHDLRHTFATRLVAAGLDIAEVGRLLGHSSLTMTYRYVNAADDLIARARRHLDAHTQTYTQTTSAAVIQPIANDPREEAKPA